MNIILQNYTNLIEKLIKNTILNNINNSLSYFQGFNINNYINVIHTFDNSLSDCFTRIGRFLYYMCISIKSPKSQEAIFKIKNYRGHQKLKGPPLISRLLAHMSIGIIYFATIITKIP